jgi:hypothetical protein
MKIKTSELQGAALDWAVAKAVGEYKPTAVPNYSTDWAQGGPIIEREGIGIWSSESGEHDGEWCARTISTYITYSPTPLTAAMRCYVASKLGDEVEVPDELHTV